jgi:hypothetical protein
MRLLFVILFLVSVTVHYAIAQHTNVLISNTNSPNEPSISINPKNTNEMVAGSNIPNVHYSVNGGITWVTDILTSSYGVWGDPVIACDTTGRFYFFHLSNPPSGSWIDRIVCQSKPFIGGTWNNGSFTGLNGGKEQDKQWVSIDRKNNAIYMTWTEFDDYGSSNPADSSRILFSKSTNQGQTWSQPVQINEVSGDCIDSDNTTEGAVPAVGPNGEVYVSWAGSAGLVFDRSLDGGNTWLQQDIFVSTIPGGWDYNIPGIYRANGLPVTVCDTSGGPNHGTIYINWTDQRNGTSNTDVWLVKSTDGGNTWSQPVKVNDDMTTRHQFFTWMAVDQVTGYLWFVWYDRRNYSDNRTDVYMARSADGGNTFQNFKISDTPFIPSSGVFFGDYTNVAAYNNVVRPVWTRLHNQQLSVWTALVDPLVVGVESPVDLYEKMTLEQNMPNPFSDKTAFSFKLHEATVITLKVFDFSGRHLSTPLENKWFGYGKHIIPFNDKLSSGTYFYEIHAQDRVMRRKMMVVE